MLTFRRLALASTVATLLLVTIGGLVRATKSGLGCGTDWPRCSGDLVPALENRAMLIEYTHRLVASLVVLLLGALVVVAWRRLRGAPHLRRAAVVAFGLVLLQALLGAVVVKLELEAVSVVLHLVTAMALLAVLVYISAGALPARATYVADAAVARRARWAAAAVLVLLMAGSYVSGSEGAGLAFGDWPLMNGRLIPELSAEPAALHFTHRALALAVGIIVAVVCVGVIRRRDELVVQARLAHVALGAFAVEVLIGAANVWTELDAAVVTTHLLVGTIVWGSLVGVAVVSRPMAAAASDRARALSEPVLDASRP
jgi:cytochrome c oxidase assembly protein subunit 15